MTAPAAHNGVRRRLWQARDAGLWTDPEVRALRLTGDIDERRLLEAVDEVVAALPALRMGFAALPHLMDPVPVDRPASVHRHEVDDDGDPHRACLDLLDADRRRPIDPCGEPLIRIHVIRRGAGDWVLGLVADPLAVDLRSVYLILGALMQAYLGRFRVEEYPECSLLAPSTPAGTPRWRWWADRLDEWSRAGEALSAGVMGSRAGTAESRTAELLIDGATWARLTSSVSDAGHAGTLSVVALLLRWLRTHTGGHGPAVFAGTLDLRELLGLGPTLGPLTERILYEVDQTGIDQLSFADVVRRVHAGMLDSVVHHVAHDELTAISTARGGPTPDLFADVVVHYCRAPPASGHTRDDPTLAAHGLSIELYAESELATPARPSGARAAHPAAMELRVAESGAGMALLVRYDSGRIRSDVVNGLLSDLACQLDQPAAEVGELSS